MKILIVFLFLLVSSIPSRAATIRVERDGSGDYAVIQDAVDVAASGDTILIGPGRFDEGRIVTTPGWTEYVRVVITQEELTLIGAGIGQTIIGRQEPWDRASHGTDKGIEGGQWWGVQRLVVEGISFENMAHGIVSEPAADLIVRACSFSGIELSVIAMNGHSVTVENCEFRDPALSGNLLLSGNNEFSEIFGSQFSLPNGGGALKITTNGRIVVQECEVTGGRYAGYFIGNQSIEIGNCILANQSRTGLDLVGNQNTTVEDCILSGQKMAFNVSGSSTQTEIHRVTITDVSQVSVGFDAVGQFTMENCVIAHGPEYSVWQYNICSDADKAWYYLDMRNNDWGTLDAATIASWLSICMATIDYIPYIGMPVATEEKSWGSVKSMFR